jgi:hypothetical protein
MSRGSSAASRSDVEFGDVWLNHEHTQLLFGFYSYTEIYHLV